MSCKSEHCFSKRMPIHFQPVHVEYETHAQSKAHKARRPWRIRSSITIETYIEREAHVNMIECNKHQISTAASFIAGSYTQQSHDVGVYLSIAPSTSVSLRFGHGMTSSILIFFICFLLCAFHFFHSHQEPQ